MEFVEDMQKAMFDLVLACRKNEEWVNCKYCPFRKYCDVLEANGLGTPDDWRNFLEIL